MPAQVTIVIPSHRRPGLLAQALAHYAPAGLPVLVLDSSPEPFGPAPAGVGYHHVPTLGFEAKMALAAREVATPLCVLCADDDFTIPRSILRCAEFLAAHRDHSGAHGHYLRVLRQGGEALLEPCYLSTRQARVDAEDPRQRLVQVNRPYVPLFYAVLRAEVLRLAFSAGHEQERFYAASELALGMAAAMLGKVAVLPTLHAVRDIVPSVDLAGPKNDDLGVVSTAPEYREVFGLFVERLAREFAARSGLPHEEARAAVLASVHGFVQGYCQKGGRKSLFRKLPKYGRRLARALSPALAARHAEDLRLARERALAEYLGPVAQDYRAELEDILQQLRRRPG